MLNEQEALRILRRLKENTYNVMGHGIEDRVDALDRKLDDVIELVEALCRMRGLNP